jgi:hypothetical protein
VRSPVDQWLDCPTALVELRHPWERLGESHKKTPLENSSRRTMRDVLAMFMTLPHAM